VREVPRRADHGGRGHRILVDPTHAVIDWANHEHDIEESERPHPRGRRIQPDLGWPVDDPEEQRDAVDYALAVAHEKSSAICGGVPHAHRYLGITTKTGTMVRILWMP
jgi:hypothetical protein